LHQEDQRQREATGTFNIQR